VAERASEETRRSEATVLNVVEHQMAIEVVERVVGRGKGRDNIGMTNGGRSR
jgi:hypothetical protein